mmetsp:Transcript_20455/g.78602  ORF Transcript_20455/g.78602 Transcript_20455/m.78602 type:complete len:342 (-) Transcript_20455:228-1253(-)
MNVASMAIPVDGGASSDIKLLVVDVAAAFQVRLHDSPLTLVEDRLDIVLVCSNRPSMGHIATTVRDMRVLKKPRLEESLGSLNICTPRVQRECEVRERETGIVIVGLSGTRVGNRGDVNAANLLLEEVCFVEKEHDWLGLKRLDCRARNLKEQVLCLVHTILRPRLEQHLVVLRRGCHEDDRGDVVEKVDPLAPLASLASDVAEAERCVSYAYQLLVQASCAHPTPDDVVGTGAVVWRSDESDAVEKVAGAVAQLQRTPAIEHALDAGILPERVDGRRHLRRNAAVENGSVGVLHVRRLEHCPLVVAGNLDTSLNACFQQRSHGLQQVASDDISPRHALLR